MSLLPQHDDLSEKTAKDVLPSVGFFPTKRYGLHRGFSVSVLESLPRSLRQLASLLYKARIAFRSSYAHMNIQCAIRGASLPLGPAPLVPDSRPAESTRTLVRAADIEKLRATLPWADTVDLRFFLIGFDAGVEYCKTHSDFHMTEGLDALGKTCIELTRQKAGA